MITKKELDTLKDVAVKLRETEKIEKEKRDNECKIYMDAQKEIKKDYIRKFVRSPNFIDAFKQAYIRCIKNNREGLFIMCWTPPPQYHYYEQISLSVIEGGDFIVNIVLLAEVLNEELKDCFTSSCHCAQSYNEHNGYILIREKK